MQTQDINQYNPQGFTKCDFCNSKKQNNNIGGVDTTKGFKHICKECFRKSK